VKAVGVRTNRTAVGARLRATIRQSDQTSARHRVVTSGGSFGASSYIQHFGLGGATRVEELEVVWPTSGTRQTFKDIAADQTIEIREGDATVRVIAPPNRRPTSTPNAQRPIPK
jgi:hypothetical protein